MTTTKTVGLVIAGVIVSVLFSGMMIAQMAGNTLGGVYTQSEQTQARLIIGDGGSAQTFFKKGTCNLTQSVVGSHAATTSKAFHCAVTGAKASDTVNIILPSGAGIGGSPLAGFVVNTSFATATDMIGASIANLSGAATTSYTQATTSVTYLIYR